MREPGRCRADRHHSGPWWSSLRPDLCDKCDFALLAKHPSHVPRAREKVGGHHTKCPIAVAAAIGGNNCAAAVTLRAQLYASFGGGAATADAPPAALIDVALAGATPDNPAVIFIDECEWATRFSA